MARRIRRGTVYWVDLSPGRRPGLVLTRDHIIPKLNHVTVVPTTQTIRNIPSEVTIGPKDGMPDECVLNTDHIVTVPKEIVDGPITDLDQHTIRTVKSALLFALGWDYEAVPPR